MTMLPMGPRLGRAGTALSQTEGLDRALWQLSRVTELGEGLLDERQLQAARQLHERAGQRRRLAPSLTVAALLGATGSGKSSLFNALLGQEVARTAVTRPTTTKPLAAVPAATATQAKEATALLDWLGVDERAEVTTAPGAAALGSGTVLLDLPDIDSDAREHRVITEGMSQLVDVLVWVLDPEKYADALVHRDFLSQLYEHARVTLVVLNQVDRLAPADRQDVLADLARLLNQEGLGSSALLAVSARTGEGLEALREQIAQVAQARTARDERLSADVRHWATQLSDQLGIKATSGSGQSQAEGAATEPWDALRQAARAAASVELVSQAVSGSYRRSAQLRVGWIPLRWLARLRKDPLRVLHLLKDQPKRSATAESGRDVVVGRSSLPAPSAAAAGTLRTSAHNCAAAALAALPENWAAEVLARSDQRALKLPEALDRAVVSTDLESGKGPNWWKLANSFQWLSLVTALVGGAWLLGLHLARSYLLVKVSPPMLGRLPYPTVLLGIGLLSGLLLAVLGTLLARIGARRVAARVHKRLYKAADAVVQEQVIAPLHEELYSWDELTSSILELRS
ncbi:GTPase Era [Actinomyces bovis]|uniref:GTPase Era n=1 Tax=Actinomyces bovis TaxID=1658 RepID=A0ABY1VPM2_9ACTO|nr:GTPase [Actinomyces bovis]SPT54075.1 GTPase Era [Actinomyces bovis]VEG53728.1 GTPase Era [Actinomyces israelii]